MGGAVVGAAVVLVVDVVEVVVADVDVVLARDVVSGLYARECGAGGNTNDNIVMNKMNMIKIPIATIIQSVSMRGSATGAGAFRLARICKPPHFRLPYTFVFLFKICRISGVCAPSQPHQNVLL